MPHPLRIAKEYIRQRRTFLGFTWNVFWLTVELAYFPPSHPVWDNGFRVSSPFTAARPRPVFTDFRFHHEIEEHYPGDGGESQVAGGHLQQFVI
jgi:hypothetical protein